MSGLAGKIRILHVDDEPDLADMAAEFVERHGDRLVVDTAMSASDALDHLTQADIDCIVSDFDMPGQDGIELLKTVRETHPDLPFILYTGKGSEEVASEAISAGVTDYLQKQPGTSQYEVLANRIQNVVEQRRAREEIAETEERLQTIAENTNDILWKFDAEWTDVRFINSAYEEIWGRSTDELREDPQSFLQGIHPDDRDFVRAAMRELSAGDSVDIEYRVNADEDFSRWVWVQGEPVFDDSGRVEKVVGFARDITDRKERERELHEQQAELRLYERAFEGSTDLLAAVDAEYNLMFANERYRDYHGLSRDAIDHIAVPEYLEDSWETTIKPRLDRTLSGEELRYTMERPGPDGDARTLDIHYYPLLNEEGSIVGSVASMRDITDQARHEARIDALHTTSQDVMAAESAEAVAEIVVRAINDILDMPINGLWYHDDDENTLRPVSWTDEGAALIGDPPTFKPGQGLAGEAFETGDPAHYDDLSTEPGRLNEDTDIRSEILLPLGDHGLITIGSTEPAAFDATDVSMVRTLAAHTETALDNLEHARALRASEARYRTLTEDVLDKSRVGTFILDPDFEIVWINEAIQEFFGVDRAEIVGMDKRELIAEQITDVVEDADEFTATVLATYEDNTNAERFECYVTPVGDQDGRWLEHWSQPIESGLYEGGRIEHYTDITAQREYERRLERQNDQLEEFASVVSHDLRNPLNVAKGRLELAREDCSSVHLDAMPQALERMDALLEDLLTLAREGDAVGELEPVELADISHRCWANVETGEASFQNESSHTVYANESRLQQLVENLIRNGVEHGGETVTITVGDLADGFYVSDDGTGIPEDDKEQVLEAGYSTAEEGTGFGLAIVREIAEAHGWDTAITAGNNGGARFEFTNLQID